jgi:hypothetical protein
MELQAPLQGVLLAGGPRILQIPVLNLIFFGKVTILAPDGIAVGECRNIDI